MKHSSPFEPLYPFRIVLAQQPGCESMTIIPMLARFCNRSYTMSIQQPQDRLTILDTHYRRPSQLEFSPRAMSAEPLLSSVLVNSNFLSYHIGLNILDVDAQRLGKVLSDRAILSWHYRGQLQGQAVLGSRPRV
ncbi:hypothetical protein FRC20_001261 [Serendipita sp. 405]|nr:hypothetical protein FRC16_001224 [Serendipita sp. 398]KAG8853336.1 hypothetical protein FRC20_001261 [Serendipita sp. 405]